MKAETESRRERVVGVAELAKILDISEKTVRRHVAQGRIPYYKVGGMFRFNVDEVFAATRQR